MNSQRAISDSIFSDLNGPNECVVNSNTFFEWFCDYKGVEGRREFLAKKYEATWLAEYTALANAREDKYHQLKV
jgi:hypothetical protein